MLVTVVFLVSIGLGDLILVSICITRLDRIWCAHIYRSLIINCIMCGRRHLLYRSSSVITVWLARLLMFSWSGVSGCPLISALNNPLSARERSRSPRPSQPSVTIPNNLSSSVPFASAVPIVEVARVASWGTGIANMDSWMTSQLDPEVLVQFAEITLQKRKSIVIGMMKTPPQNPNSWAKACLRNYREQQFERQVAGGNLPQVATQHNGSPASAGSPNMGSHHFQTMNATVMQGALISQSSQSSGNECAGTRRTLFKADDGVPERWVGAAWTLWQNSKSNFLAEIHNRLGEVVRGRFQMLPPKYQIHMGFGLLFGSSTILDLDQLVNGWCDRYDALCTGAALSSVPMSGVPISTSPLSVQFILCGGVLASSNILTWVAMQCIASCRPDLRLEMRSVIEVGYREIDIRVARGVFVSKACFPRSDASLTPSALNDAVTEFLPLWKELNTKIIFVIQMPKVLTSVNNCSDLDGHLIHGLALRHLFDLRKGIETISNGLGYSNIATVVFAAPEISTLLRSDLSEMFGNVVAGVDSTIKYNDLVPSPVVFSNPVDLTVVKNTRPVPESDKVDNWIFSTVALRNLGSRVLPLNPDALSKNACALLLGERTLLPEEENLLRVSKMKHEITGELRLPSRDFFGRQLGFEGSPIMRIVNEQFKCLQWIIPSTGQGAPSGLKGGEACGQSRYCMECEALFHDLATMYHLSTCADIVTSCFLKSLMTWQDGRGTHDFVVLPKHLSSHKCGPDCPSNPFRGL
jgi:hypothetical protein